MSWFVHSRSILPCPVDNSSRAAAKHNSVKKHLVLRSHLSKWLIPCAQSGLGGPLAGGFPLRSATTRGIANFLGCRVKINNYACFLRDRSRCVAMASRVLLQRAYAASQTKKLEAAKFKQSPSQRGGGSDNDGYPSSRTLRYLLSDRALHQQESSRVRSADRAPCRSRRAQSSSPSWQALRFPNTSASIRVMPGRWARARTWFAPASTTLPPS